MSKGNSRKGNLEATKPKKETPIVLATANTISNPTRLELECIKKGSGNRLKPGQISLHIPR